ncbi:M48 family metallopeptidase [Methylosinus sp. KRF6]|uniref:M48 family metallopeptidase n=1 Tax=Methylosinus sp. KRF6 TaxID=2846853 RepID=UPI001C0B8C1B|nr:SprT family zinc-dependent metalloprotease [Methylosinus sp. KRF6]MBU3887920.1 M48 family metallopeptidase [Methylosinus sp. KRF6]
MTTECHSIQYGESRIAFAIVRRGRTTLEIAVEPDASVVVAAPRNAPLAAIEAKVRKRAAWIQRQQRYFNQFLPRTPDRRYVAGETHLYLGRLYRLKVVFHIQASVKLARGLIVVQTHRPDRAEVTRELVEAWYRERAHAKFAERLELNLLRFPAPDDFRPKGLIVRHLRQRWGSMSPSRRLLLNRRLIEAPTDAIDYVITHELCHIAVPHHGLEFFEILNRVLPDWRERKQRLELRMA